VNKKKNSKNTKKAIKVALNVFRQYLSEERKVDEKELSASNVKLVAVLRKFYAEARKKNRELYTKALLVGICFRLQRFLCSQKMDIIKDPHFAKFKHEGKAQTQHKLPNKQRWQIS